MSSDALPNVTDRAVAFQDELYLIGTLADDHDTEYDGGHWTTPSLIDHDEQEDT